MRPAVVATTGARPDGTVCASACSGRTSPATEAPPIRRNVRRSRVLCITSSVGQLLYDAFPCRAEGTLGWPLVRVLELLAIFRIHRFRTALHGVDRNAPELR